MTELQLLKSRAIQIALTLAIAFAFGLGATHSLSANQKECTMDIQCGVGKKCSSGVCTGGIAPKIKGQCVKGKFGKKVCSNTGEACMNDSQCLR
ncbi:MAG: hypothetical protein NXI24_24310 [bacterium]|nr:hypothetical protein [bacterium]